MPRARRKVKVTSIYTPKRTQRTLYPGETYTLAEGTAEEVVAAGAGRYADAGPAAGSEKEPSHAELKARARDLGVEGYSSMNKAALEAAIEAKEAE